MRPKPLFLVGIVVAIGVFTSACAASSNDGGDTTTTLDQSTESPSQSDDEQPTSTTEGTLVLAGQETKPITGTYDSVFTPGDIDKGLAPFISLAVADLTDRLGIAASDVVVVTATVVVWSDAGLGCPEPDMLYAQVPTDGSLIELSVDNTMYRYHSGGQRQPFLCDQPLKEPPATTDIDL